MTKSNCPHCGVAFSGLICDCFSGHIHVEVPSAVVLVRDGEFLRIHPRPSWFD